MNLNYEQGEMIMRDTKVSTSQLIDSFCDDLPEKHTFRSPLVYFAGWLISSVFFVLIYLNIFLEVRFDLLHRMTDTYFLLSVGTMLLGSCCFAYGALSNAIPGQRSIFDRLGLVFFAIWASLILSSMAYNFNGLVTGDVYIRIDMNIFFHLVVAGFIPLATLWTFVRRLTPVKPKRIALSACLSSFMLSAALLRFFYVHLYNGADCSYALFFWMLIPFVIASIASWKVIHPKFRMKNINKREFLDRRNQVTDTALVTS